MDDVKKALSLLMAQAEANGVASLKLKDGEYFIFSRETVVNLLNMIDEKNEKFGIIFVKTGPNVSDIKDV